MQTEPALMETLSFMNRPARWMAVVRGVQHSCTREQYACIPASCACARESQEEAA